MMQLYVECLKKFYFFVDIYKQFCYINGATCEKSVKLYNIKYCYYYCISYIL